MSKHTQGPWVVKYAYNVIAEDPVKGEFGRGIACCGGYSEHGRAERIAQILQESEANARLIAAAPDMVDALRPLAALLTKYHADFADSRPIFGIDDGEAHHIITVGDLRAAQAAISKAEGSPCGACLEAPPDFECPDYQAAPAKADTPTKPSGLTTEQIGYNLKCLRQDRRAPSSDPSAGLSRERAEQVLQAAKREGLSAYLRKLQGKNLWAVHLRRLSDGKTEAFLDGWAAVAEKEGRED